MYYLGSDAWGAPQWKYSAENIFSHNVPDARDENLSDEREFSIRTIRLRRRLQEQNALEELGRRLLVSRRLGRTGVRNQVSYQADRRGSNQVSHGVLNSYMPVPYYHCSQIEFYQATQWYYQPSEMAYDQPSQMAYYEPNLVVSTQAS